MATSNKKKAVEVKEQKKNTSTQDLKEEMGKLIREMTNGLISLEKVNIPMGNVEAVNALQSLIRIRNSLVVFANSIETDEKATS